MVNINVAADLAGQIDRGIGEAHQRQRHLIQPRLQAPPFAPIAGNFSIAQRAGQPQRRKMPAGIIAAERGRPGQLCLPPIITAIAGQRDLARCDGGGKVDGERRAAVAGQFQAGLALAVFQAQAAIGTFDQQIAAFSAAQGQRARDLRAG